MTYQVSRNGQMYGPYALEDLKRYVASGNILLTDLAKSEEMPDWLPVSQIIGILRRPGGRRPMRLPSLIPQATGMAYPDPPNLNWGLELLLGFLTCTLFVMVWNLVIASWANRVEPASKALMYYIIATVLIVLNFGGSWGVMISIAHHNQPHQHFRRQSDRHRRLGRPSHRSLHSARHPRTALQWPRAARPAVGCCDDILLRRHLLPVQTERDQPAQAGCSLPERSSMTSSSPRPYRRSRCVRPHHWQVAVTVAAFCCVFRPAAEQLLSALPHLRIPSPSVSRVRSHTRSRRPSTRTLQRGDASQRASDVFCFQSP